MEQHGTNWILIIYVAIVLFGIGYLIEDAGLGFSLIGLWGCMLALMKVKNFMKWFEHKQERN